MNYVLLIATVFYLLAAGLACMRLTTAAKSANKLFISAIGLALLSHAYWLYQHILMDNGQNLPVINVLLLISFILSLLSTIAGKYFNTNILQPLVYACAAVSLVTVHYLPGHFITHIGRHPELAVHILFALLSYSILMMACLFALLLAYLDLRLKNHKQPLNKVNIPPMMSLEKDLFRMIAIGFFLLSAALLSSLPFIDKLFIQNRLEQILLSLLAWGIYALLLWGHYKKGWRGRFTLYMTINSSLLLTLAYFGSRFLQHFLPG